MTDGPAGVAVGFWGAPGIAVASVVACVNAAGPRVASEYSALTR